MPWSVPAQDLRDLLDLTQPSYDSPVEGEQFDHGVLARLAEVFECVSVTYQVTEPSAERLLHIVEGMPHGAEVVDVEVYDEEWSRVYWPAHWENLSCCYPETTGDHESVTMIQDFLSHREWANGVMGELCDRMECLMVPLPWAGRLDRRLMLWRVEGEPFSEADRLLLTLLRPHFARLLDDHDRAAKGQPPLTPREQELMVLVADGLTNRQIGRALGISEGTVRKHLEHVFGRLGVTNRVAAVAACPVPRADRVSALSG